MGEPQLFQRQQRCKFLSVWGASEVTQLLQGSTLASPGPPHSQRSVHINHKVRWSLPQQISNSIIKAVNSVTPANVFQRYFETVIWSYCFHPRALPALPCCILYYLRPRGQSKLLLFANDQKLRLERELSARRPHCFLDSFLNLQPVEALLRRLSEKQKPAKTTQNMTTNSTSAFGFQLLFTTLKKSKAAV